MKKILPIILFLCYGMVAAQLTDQSRISLITCAPGDIVYEKFGHSALRINDPTLGIDWVFHYGVFDFEQEFFIPKFVQGATDYEIGLCPTNAFTHSYAQRGSAVEEQVLNLTLEQRQRLFDALAENYKPENRTYRYNFVFDNCATRPYHMVMNVLDKPALCTYSTDSTTYRDIVHGCIGWHNWTAFGIALVLGSEADLPTGNEGAIGFPAYLHDELAETWIQTAPDTIVPLVAAHRKIVDLPDKPIESTPTLLWPTTVFAVLLLLGIVLTVADWKHRRISLWFDVPLFGICGLAGCIIFYLMCFSQHPLVGANWNLIWLNPLWLVFAVLAPVRCCNRSKRHMAFCLSVLLAAGFATQFCHIQTFHTANRLIIMLMAVRLVPYLRKTDNPKNQPL